MEFNVLNFAIVKFYDTCEITDSLKKGTVISNSV